MFSNYCQQKKFNNRKIVEKGKKCYNINYEYRVGGFEMKWRKNGRK